MLKKRNWILQNVKLLMLVLIMTGLFVNLSPQLQAQTNSAPISPNSAIRADDEGLRKACAEAIEELKAARKLLEKQSVEIEVQKRLSEIQTDIEQKLSNINQLSEREKEELRKSLAAKDREIDMLDRANFILRSRQMTPWKVFKIAVVAGAAGVVLGKVLK